MLWKNSKFRYIHFLYIGYDEGWYMYAVLHSFLCGACLEKVKPGIKHWRSAAQTEPCWSWTCRRTWVWGLFVLCHIIWCWWAAERLSGWHGFLSVAGFSHSSKTSRLDELYIGMWVDCACDCTSALWGDCWPVLGLLLTVPQCMLGSAAPLCTHISRYSIVSHCILCVVLHHTKKGVCCNLYILQWRMWSNSLGREQRNNYLTLWLNGWNK